MTRSVSSYALVRFIAWLTVLLVTVEAGADAREVKTVAEDVVTYEAFGAVGDGVTDDLPAIVKAHAYANEHRLPVRSNPEATYHLGRRALTAIIQTDTDWSTSRFIIDDSQGVEDHKRSIFEVKSRFAPVPLEITRLSAGQPGLEVRPEQDLLVYVENDQRRVFIRRGLNVNNGTPQKEVFILKKDGSIEGAIQWDYEKVTRVVAQPIDPEPLVIRGGVFISIANRMIQPVGYNYWLRNILITRSNVIVDGISCDVAGETDFGHPYHGFLNVECAANITFRNCRVEPRKWYSTIGRAGLPVHMGTYGYRGDLVVNFTMQHCRMRDIHDSSRWGVAATNFMKNVLLEDCVLSRMDVHQGVSGHYTMRRCTLGHMGVNAIGSGELVIEDCSIYSRSLVQFRSDYGSTWDGTVTVRNSRWIPPLNASRTPAMFNVENDGMHDFGYPCSMPRVIRIENLVIDDSEHGDAGMPIFSTPLGALGGDVPYPYRPTELLTIHGLKVVSGIAPVLSKNPEVVKKLPTKVEIVP